MRNLIAAIGIGVMAVTGTVTVAHQPKPNSETWSAPQHVVKPDSETWS